MVQGGACFDLANFYTFTDCDGGTAGLGKRLYSFDTANATAEWVRCVAATLGAVVVAVAVAVAVAMVPPTPHRDACGRVDSCTQD